MRVLVTGAAGLVGGAFVDELERRGHFVVTTQRAALDLRDTDAVEHFFFANRGVFDWVVLAAARVGGIGANLADGALMLLDNLRIQNNVIEYAAACGVKRLLFLGSSCLYPRTFLDPTAPPFLELDLGMGALEESNRPYALAKLAGIELCRTLARSDFTPLVLMPPNLHGPIARDNYHPTRSHVLQAMIRRFVEATHAGAATVELWGTGAPRREFMRVEEVARAGVRLLEHPSPAYGVYNVGHGYDVSIRDLAQRVGARVGYEGLIRFDGDPTRDGTFSKTVDPRRLRNEIAWAPVRSMFDEIDQTIDEYVSCA